MQYPSKVTINDQIQESESFNQTSTLEITKVSNKLENNNYYYLKMSAVQG